MTQPISLDDRLLAVSHNWAEAHGATLARLGRRVLNDSSFFGRFDGPKASTTTATLAKFARFFADRGNWPDGRVPAEAIAFCHVNGVSVADGEDATGKPETASRADIGEAA